MRSWRSKRESVTAESAEGAEKTQRGRWPQPNDLVVFVLVLVLVLENALSSTSTSTITSTTGGIQRTV